MKAIYRRFIVGILSLVAILSVAFVFNASQTSKPVLASTNYDFTIQDGASIRINLETNIGKINNAIRFATYLEKSDLETAQEGGNVVGVYTLIAKYDELKATTQDFDENNLSKYMTLEYFTDNQVPCVRIAFTGDRLKPTNACEKGDNYYQYNACIYDLTDEELTTKFVARSYLVINGDTENAQYTEGAVVRSIFDVAEALVNAKDEGNQKAIETYNSNPTLVDYLSTKFKVTINSDFAETVTLNIPRGQKLSDFAEEYKEISTDKKGLAYYNGLLEGETAFDVEKAITGEKRDITLTADYDSLTFETITEGVSVALTGAESKFYSRNRVYIDEEQTAFESIVNVPSKYKGMDVVAVKETAFNGAYFLTTVILPDSVTQLGGGAFFNCANLTTVVMPGVTTFANISNTETAVNTFSFSNRLAILVVNSNLELPRSMAAARADGKEPCPPVGITLCIAGETDNVSITNDKNDMINDTRYLYNADGACGTWRYQDGVPDVTHHIYTDANDYVCNLCGDIKEHTHADNLEDPTGKCVYCDKVLTEGLTYTYNETYKGYMVSYGSCTATEVYVLSEYDDGTNGKKDVVGLSSMAFWAKTVTKIVLPKTVKYATELSLGGLSYYVETIIMPGITEFYGNNIYKNGVRLFWNNSNLKTIVVSPKIVWGPNVFANNNVFSEINICVDSTTEWVEMPTDSNGVVTGNIFLYNATSNAQCGSWTYVDGIPTPSTAAHTYTDANDYVCNVCGNIKEHTHVENFEEPTGKCKYCDKVLSEGLTYTYNETLGGYVVSPSSTFTADKLFVLGEYDDGGVNGKHDVVAAKGFAQKNITMVVLPKQVKYLIGNCFAGCAKLTTIIMPGVLGSIGDETTTEISKDTRFNTFFNSGAIVAAVVNSQLIMNRFFFASANITTGELVLYINGDTNKIVIGSSNNLLNDTIYLKSQWQYNSDGIPTPLNEA